MAIPLPPGPYTNLREISDAMASVGGGTTGVSASATADSPDGGVWVYDPVGGWQYNPVRNPERSGLGGLADTVNSTLDPVVGNIAPWLIAATGAGAAGAGAFGGAGAAAAPAAGGSGLIGAAGGSGLTLGSTGASGLSMAAGGATGLTAPTSGLGALGQGYFAGESLYPVVGGATLAAGGGSAPPVGGAATSTPSLTQILAGAIPAAFGAYGANQQANAYEGLARDYMNMGAPYRTRLSDLYSNPSAFLNSPEVQVPVQQGTNALARALSVNHGNPIGSGGALQELQNYSANQLFGRLGQEKDRLAGFGGLTAYNAAAPGAASNAINANKGIYDAIGAGAADIFYPPRRYSLSGLAGLA